MTKRVLISVAIFGPIYAYLAFSWTQCLDGSCQSENASQTIVIALVSFVLLLLLVGVGSAFAGSNKLRDAVESRQADEAAMAGVSLWLAFKLFLVAAVGCVALVSLV